MKVLILGANGEIASWVVQDSSHIEFVLTSKHGQGKILAVDAGNYAEVVKVMTDVDVVYANLYDGKKQPIIAQTIIRAMAETGVHRLIWISTIGIYDEIKGAGRVSVKMQLGSPDGQSYMGDQARAAKIIENSPVDYTIIRANALTNEPLVRPLTLTPDHAPVSIKSVTRRSIAAYILSLLDDPTQDVRASIAVSN